MVSCRLLTGRQKPLHLPTKCSCTYLQKRFALFCKTCLQKTDRTDTTPWASFVLKASQVHENKFGKGLWVKLPAGAHITVTKPVAVGVENGKTVWNNEKKSVSVPELKSMVEFYKEKGRDSVMGQLGDMKKTAGEKAQAQPARQKKRTEIAK